MKYLSVDTEATGVVAGLYSMISVGATKIVQKGGNFEPGESLYLELKPAFPGVDAGAMAVNKLDLERLKREGLDPREAMRRLAEFALSMRETPDEWIIFVGHNAAFDWAYCNLYFATFGVPNPFHYAPLDIKSLAVGALGISWDQAKKSFLNTRLGLPLEDETRAHRADYDAFVQAEVFCALMNTLRQRRG